MSKITDAFKIIAEELPKFFTETGTPFLGKDEPQSVMKDKSPIQKEKEINEFLLKLGAAAPAVLKGITTLASIPHAGKAATIGTAVATQDPTMLIPGKAGVLASLGTQAGDAEAMVVPARFTHTADEISKALGSLRKGEMPKAVYEAGKKGEDIGGVYLGPKDSKIKSVISDRDAKIANIEAGTLGEFLQHDKLFEKVPELKDIKVQKLSQDAIDEYAKKGHTIGGGYDPKTDTLVYNPNRKIDEILSSVLHETQHGVQSRYDFVPGSNLQESVNHPRLIPEMENFIKQKGYDPQGTYPEAVLDEVLLNVKHQIYKKGAGETEARATQRMFEQNKGNAYPLDSYDVPLDHLLRPVQNP